MISDKIHAYCNSISPGPQVHYIHADCISPLPGKYTGNVEPEKAPKQQTPESDIIGIIIGSLAGLIAILIAVVIFIVCRHQRRKKNNNRRMKIAITDTHNQTAVNLSDLRGTHTNGKVLKGHVYNGVPLTELESDRDCCSGESESDLRYPGPVITELIRTLDTLSQ